MGGGGGGISSAFWSLDRSGVEDRSSKSAAMRRDKGTELNSISAIRPSSCATATKPVPSWSPSMGDRHRHPVADLDFRGAVE